MPSVLSRLSSRVYFSANVRAIRESSTYDTRSFRKTHPAVEGRRFQCPRANNTRIRRTCAASLVSFSEEIKCGRTEKTPWGRHRREPHFPESFDNRRSQIARQQASVALPLLRRSPTTIPFDAAARVPPFVLPPTSLTPPEAEVHGALFERTIARIAMILSHKGPRLTSRLRLAFRSSGARRR